MFLWSCDVVVPLMSVVVEGVVCMFVLVDVWLLSVLLVLCVVVVWVDWGLIGF